MTSKLGFYELLEPHFAWGLATKNLTGSQLLGIRNALSGAGASGPRTSLSGAPQTLSKFVTDVLDYLSVEELHTSFDENAVVYRGYAMFGGEGSASPDLPPNNSITSGSGQNLKWLDNRFEFRITVPRRGNAPAFDTSGLTPNDLTDLQALNTLLTAFEEPGGASSDKPGNDFRLELLIKTIHLTLPKSQFIPAKIGADGWLEPDTSVKEVVFRFPTLAFVLEQKGDPGDLDFSFRSWDAHGFDDPGDAETGRAFTIEPPFFLHTSRYVGFGIDRLVADFSDDVTPTEILEQFGIGDDFNGLWLPLLQIFVAPGRTTGFAFSARAKDLLIDFDKGVSGDFSLDMLRRGGEFQVDPVFYSKNSKTAVEWHRGAITRGADGTVNVKQSQIRIPGDGEMQIAIRGSISPYNVKVDFDGAPFAPDVSAGPSRPKWIIPNDKSGVIDLTVTDKGNKNTWREKIEVVHVAAALPKAPPEQEKKYRIDYSAGTLLPQFQGEVSGLPTDPAYTIVRVDDPADTKNKTLVVRVDPPVPEPTLVNISTGQAVPRRPDGTYLVPMTTENEPAQLIAKWVRPTEDAPPAPSTVDEQKLLVKGTGEYSQREGLYFKYFFPKKGSGPTPEAVADSIMIGDDNAAVPGVGIGVTIVNGKTQLVPGTRGEIKKRFQNLLNSTQGDITIGGYASKEGKSLGKHNDDVSEMRAKTLAALLTKLQGTNPTRTISAPAAEGDEAASEDEAKMDGDDRYRGAFATAKTLESKIHAASTTVLVPLPADPVPAAPVEHPPASTEPERPPIFRKVGIRFKLARGEWVLLEATLELDFRTQAENTEGFIKVNDTRNDGSTGIADKVQTTPGASKSEEQGVLDARFTLIYDRPTRRVTQQLAVGFDQQNAKDGWVRLEGTSPDPTTFENTIGSLLVFLPIINEGIDSAVNAEGGEATKDLVILATEVALATTIGLTGMLKFKKWTLFGIELSATEILSDDIENESTRLDSMSVMLDYAVDFEVDIDLGILTIKSRKKDNKPATTRVRYRGFGVRADFGGEGYQSVFDTSKGFELGIAEPGALEVGGPLGPILKIISVKVARQNPLILETDLGLNANLGVVQVESVRVRVPIDPPGIPTIIPTAISVNIEGAVVGSGYLNVRDTGFEGAIDITIVPSKLRVQASVGLQRIEDGDRKITAFFLGIGVEFPGPIPLANSGLGLYGLLGLFGMHYKRDEDTPVNPNLPPALDWYYNKAKGEPHMIAVEGRPTWIAAPDRWSFGLGAVLGTTEGAFILNLKGMLVLELPGPRILVFVRAQIIKPRPPSGKPADQTVGILAVVDLNFDVGYIAIGLIFAYEIKDLLKIEIPIDSSFSTKERSDWHLYIGSVKNKASADILGITKGTGYLMFDGQGIDFPLGELKGFSVAAGIAASLVLGDESSGLYAKVSGALDVGVSTEPLHFYGQLKLEGRLHLWFVSLGASATLNIEAPEPVYVKGEVCGSVDLWFTEIEGCVGIEINEPQELPLPDEFIIGLSLQSHSPALLEGQATDQPVDGSLGVSHGPGDVLTDMPLDVIPVVQMKYPPVFGSAASGLVPSAIAPTLAPGSDGWISLGGMPGQEGDREIRYEFESLTIDPPLPGGVTEIPVTWWQPARPQTAADSQATDKGVSLALNSWIPVSFPRAYQKCEDQITTIRDRFETICRSVAPPASVLWTFNANHVDSSGGVVQIHGAPVAGYSNTGWRLSGIQWPDPPNTQRLSSPNTSLEVHEPGYPERTNLLVQDYVARSTGRTYDAAKVIPLSGPPEKGQALQFPLLQFTGVTETFPPEIANIVSTFLSAAGNRERIVVESGDVTHVRALLATQVQFKVSEFMRLLSVDAGGQVVEDIKMPGRTVTNPADLPAQWLDASGVWSSDVQRVIDLFRTSFDRTHALFLLDWKPAVPFARFELLYEPQHEQTKKPLRDPPAAMLGVVETLSRSEVEREAAELHNQEQMIDVVVNSLEQGDKRPLLAPNTEYTVTANYSGHVRKGNDHNVTTDDTFSQQFKFRTTDKPPKRIDPWVLAAVPEKDAPTHFTKDPVQFIFNDSSAIQMYAAFGRTLRAVLRNSNGNHPSTEPAIDATSLVPISAQLLTPFASSLLDVIGEMPCIPGITETEHHQVFTLNIVLDRGTTYMLDIESTPAADDPLTPLFRTSFTTSRFESAAELASVVREAVLRERPLKNVLTLPEKQRPLIVPVDADPVYTAETNVQVVTDAEMDAALASAIGSNIAPAKGPAMSIMWSSESPSRPIAILVDSPEAILRTRPVPARVFTDAQDGDVIQHYQNRDSLWLELAESGTSIVERIVYASGGCRAAAFLKPIAPGADWDLRLVLRRYRHTLLTEVPLREEFELIAMTLEGTAPWER